MTFSSSLDGTAPCPGPAPEAALARIVALESRKLYEQSVALDPAIF